MSEQEILSLLRGLADVAQRQQRQFEMLYRSYSGLLAILGGGESPAVDPAAIEKARAEITELDRLFNLTGDAAAGG